MSHGHSHDSHGHSHGGQSCNQAHGPAKQKAKTLEEINEMHDDDPNPRVLQDPSAAPDPTTLEEACERGRFSFVVMSLARGVDPKRADSSVGATPLHWAAYKGHLPIAKLLVERGCNVNGSDSRGQTPLMWAINEARFEVVQFLLDRGADPTMTDVRGCDAYSIAVQAGNLAMLHQLHLHKPINPAGLDNDGHNLLVWACYKGHLDIAEYLVDVHRVSVQCIDNQRRNALHWAAREGWIDTCVWLMGKGVDPKVTDSDGMTPHDWANAHFHFMTARVIAAHRTTPLARLSGTLTNLTSNIFFLGIFLLGILYIVGLFALATRFVPAPFCYSLFGMYMVKNFGVYAVLRTPVRNCKPAQQVAPLDLGIPKTMVESLQGTEVMDYREPSIVSIFLSFLCVQYVAMGLADIEVPVLYYALLLTAAVTATIVKVNQFVDIVPRGTASEDPILRAVERKEYSDCRWQRIFRTKQHVRVPLRAFHAKELNEVLYEYDGWSLLLDAPISRSTRRTFVAFIATLFLMQVFVAYTAFEALTTQICAPERQFSASQLAWDLFVSALPCKAKNDGSWYSFFVPDAVNRNGFWLICVTSIFAAGLGRILLDELSAASLGLSTLEMIHGTMPSTDGGLTTIMRNGCSIFASGGRLRSVLAFIAGSAGSQWRSTHAIPPPSTAK